MGFGQTVAELEFKSHKITTALRFLTEQQF